MKPLLALDQPLPPTWHCYVEDGQTYEDLVALYGKRRMLVAVLHMPESDDFTFEGNARWITHQEHKFAVHDRRMRFILIYLPLAAFALVALTMLGGYL